jgi:hypothetical protein
MDPAAANSRIPYRINQNMLDGAALVHKKISQRKTVPREMRVNMSLLIN